jgi:hypothetical protein
MSTDYIKLVLYHGPKCSDGFASYALMRDHLGDKDAVYLSMEPGKLPSDIPQFIKEIYILDTYITESDLEILLSRVDKITIIDHHKTSKIINYEHPKLTYIYDVNLSGCQLVFKTLYPLLVEPWYITYIADKDLNKNYLPNTREINKGLYEYEYLRDYNRWKKLQDITDKDAITTLQSQMTAIGKITLEKENLLIEIYIKESKLCQMEFTYNNTLYNYKVRIVECPKFEIKSDLGMRLAEMNDNDFSIVYEYNTKSIFMCCRSIKEDVGEICAILGGGGHQFAAGFTLPNFPNVINDAFPLIGESVLIADIYDLVNKSLLDHSIGNDKKENEEEFKEPHIYDMIFYDNSEVESQIAVLLYNKYVKSDTIKIAKNYHCINCLGKNILVLGLDYTINTKIMKETLADAQHVLYQTKCLEYIINKYSEIPKLWIIDLYYEDPDCGIFNDLTIDKFNELLEKFPDKSSYAKYAEDNKKILDQRILQIHSYFKDIIDIKTTILDYRVDFWIPKLNMIIHHNKKDKDIINSLLDIQPKWVIYNQYSQISIDNIVNQIIKLILFVQQENHYKLVQL